MEIGANRVNEVENDESVVEWLKNRPRNTQKVYRYAVKFFHEFTGWTPEEMLDEREKEYGLPPREGGKVASKVEEYFSWLIEEKGRAEKTAKSYCGAIASFYKKYNMPLILDWKTKFQGTPKAVNATEKMRATQVEKLASLAPTLRDKGLIWCGFQGLMDVSTVLSLNCGHVADEIANPLEGALLIRKLKRKKEKGRTFDTFIYKTAIRYLRLYLQERFGENWLDEVKNPQNYYTPLFVSRRGNRQDRQYVDDMMRAIAPMTDIANSRFQHADMNPLRYHSLRASGSSLLRNDDMDKTLVNYLMGHKVEYDGAYIDGKDRTTYVRHAERVLEPVTAESTKELEERLRDQDDKIWDLEQKLKAYEKRFGKLEEEQWQLHKMTLQALNEQKRKVEDLEMNRISTIEQRLAAMEKPSRREVR